LHRPPLLGATCAPPLTTAVNGLSPDGTILTGDFTTGRASTRGFVREDGRFEALLDLDGSAAVVNDTGLAVGEARVPGGARLPVRWRS
jgi:hypothetical protein